MRIMMITPSHFPFDGFAAGATLRTIGQSVLSHALSR